MSSRLFAALLVAVAPALAVDFAADVEPLLHQRCYMCHGASQQMSGLRLDDGAAALKGGYSGPVIVPGDAAASKLIERLTSDKEGFKMPPVGAKLTAEEIADIKAWINAGAVRPQSAAAKPTQEQRVSHWSFQPVEKPELPQVENAAWARNPVDRFILAKLEAEGVAPSPEAAKVTLIRRVSFDLTGLPPTPEQVDRFLADQSADAYETLVDELMRSPHYGERQAISWLDAARYADSEGYERDPLRDHAWRWRQWVIDALNADMPFDRFTVEQIAGDLLPDAALEQRIATGFLRNGIKNREAGVKIEEKRFEETIDRISTIGTVWLGLTVGCAQCHDHKYDAISQKEFYQLFAVFNNAVEKNIDAPLPPARAAFEQSLGEYRRARGQVLARYGILPLYSRWREQIIRAMDEPGVNTDWDFNLTEWRAANDRADWLMRTPDDGLSPIELDYRIDWFLSRIGPEFNKIPATEALLKRAREEIKALEDELLADRDMAYTMVERTEAQPAHIALRGDWRAPGLEVEPAVPAVLNDFEPKSKPVRLAFAEWLVDKRNPLTARVTVNRIWQEIFGQGLVKSTNDFGTQGAAPTHPELLDWLAARFMDSGWSQKQMVRLIVTSAAYRQSSAARPELTERDPANTWLARQNRLRLPAELVRDNALAVSGLLYDKIGGKSVHPPQPEGVTALSYSAKTWPEDRGPERYRRGMYVFIRRTSPYPMLINFDAPDTLTANVQRERTNTPLQALNLLNDPVFFEAAQALALRVAAERDAFDARIERMFRLALGRAPTSAEKDRVATYFERQKGVFAADSEEAAKVAPYAAPDQDQLDLAAWTGVARGLMNLDEFITRE